MIMLLLQFLLACSGGAGGAADCIDNGECGELQACIDETCQDVGCVTSSDCEIGRFCHPARYECQDGCLEDDDCLAGQECEGSTCRDKPCRNSELDCTAGETCNQSSGECEPATGICDQSCDPYATNPGCGQGECVITTIDDSALCMNNSECSADELCTPFLPDSGEQICFSNGDCPSGTRCAQEYFVCVVDYCAASYCMDTCNANQPDTCDVAGFECLQYDVGVNVCYGDCGYYKENGYL